MGRWWGPLAPLPPRQPITSSSAAAPHSPPPLPMMPSRLPLRHRTPRPQTAPEEYSPRQVESLSLPPLLAFSGLLLYLLLLLLLLLFCVFRLPLTQVSSSPGLQQIRPGMMSPSSPVCASSGRVGPQGLGVRMGDFAQSGLFKAPMPPQQDVFAGPGAARRDPPRPSDLNFGFSSAQEQAFPSSPLPGLSSPHRSPYSQTPGTPGTPGTPRPDYSQQVSEPFSQQSPPYMNPQTPGTPRPHSDSSYLQTPALRLDQYSPRPSPSHHGVGTAPPTPGPFGQPAGEAGSSPLALAETFANHQVSPVRQADSFPRIPSGGHTPKHPGMSEDGGFSSLPARTPTHDPFDQGHMAVEKTANEMAVLAAASLDGPMSILPQLGDSEEKLRQVSLLVVSQ